jgi:hypothetical protein
MTDRSMRVAARAGAALLVLLAVAACGSSSTPAGPSGSPSATVNGNASGRTLPVGLAANLTGLRSYQFTYVVTSAGAPGSAGASPVAGSSVRVAGTVASGGISINQDGLRFIVLGGKSWTSLDGKTWTGDVVPNARAGDFLPVRDYEFWFDANALSFRLVGDETRNGVACLHYQGDASLAGRYAGTAGDAANFEADVWIARDGEYPVGGAFSFSAAGGLAGSVGYTFEVTHVNDPANRVEAPGNVLPVPSSSPSPSPSPSPSASQSL